MTGSTYAMSDIHGHREAFERLLRAAGLISEAGAWTGGRAALWLLGDYTDRGPDGVGVIDRIMQLQVQAAEAGGEVVALLGNHEVLLLGAYHFRGPGVAGAGLYRHWKRNGGQDEDLRRLRPRHVVWLTFLPALVQRGEWLLAHADSVFYEKYGRSRDEVNEAIKQVLLCDGSAEWTNLGNWFTGRLSFLDRYEGSAASLDEFLGRFGGRRLIHGHTPIDSLHGVPPQEVTEAYVYQGGRCVNVDGGLFRGGPGLIHRVCPS
jgi:hypothetical protein